MNRYYVCFGEHKQEIIAVSAFSAKVIFSKRLDLSEDVWSVIYVEQLEKLKKK